MDLKDRIKILCKYLGISIREFERECQLNRGNISNMTGALGSDKLTKIVDRYPFINLYWLLSGKGEMTHRSQTSPTITSSPRSSKSYRPCDNNLCPKAQETLLIELQKHTITLQKKQLQILQQLLAEHTKIKEK